MDKFTHSPLRFEGYVLDATRRSLRQGDRTVDLRPKSFDVLRYLAENAGRIVPKDEIMRAVWFDVVVTDESLTRCISDVRQAIGDVGQTIIKTVPRRGYMFAAPVTSADPGVSTLAGEPVHSTHAAASAAPLVPAQKSRGFARIIAALFVLALAIAAGFLIFWIREPASLPDRPSVAVLPFSANGEAGVLGDGLSEYISTQLSRFRELVVVAHDSARKYNGASFDFDRIGQDLGVRYLVSGSVRVEGARVRVTAQLVDSTNARQLWAHSFDSELAGFFPVQDEATRQIVAALVSHIDRSEVDRVAGKKPDSLAVYEMVLRANALTRGRPNDLAAIAEAKGLYETALARDPRYARALEGLAYVHFLSWAAEKSPEYQNRPVLDRAVQLAEQAVDLDGARAEGHATLGWLLNFVDRTEEGVASFERGFELNPNFVDGRYGMLLSHVGRAPEAIAYMKRAMKLNPFHPPTHTYWLGKGYYFNGQHEQAIGLIRLGAEQQPGVLPPRVLLAAVSAHLGRDEEAKAAVAEILRLRPRFTISNWLKFLRITDEAYAERLVADLRKAGLPD